MFKVNQLKEWIIIPYLESIGLNSSAAVNLLLGTCAQESSMGTFLHQINGPAVGMYQMEPLTYTDIIVNYLTYRPDLKRKILYTCHFDSFPSYDQLISNLGFATIMTRIHYYRVFEPLPEASDVKGLAAYWKKYYNTPAGKGTEEEFISNYERYVNE